MQLTPKDKRFWSLEEIAELLEVNYQLIYRQVRQGSLPAMRVGRIYRVRREDLEAYIAMNTSGAGGGAFDCGACGKHFMSGLSRRGECTETGQPICFDCWDRKGIRSCVEKS